ncbi:gamma-aminobutyric acid type B receptor subunit 2-like [Gigantopelta aegis]|uniref:gamma-aminobutyric acid type B receptor subunit 2-like n=1 Tax=Gigantopelta aegis TaxID=1735272 RepID=UPI001B889FD8|nr:gamma-aminobutyric acid type B receptor subunit 2-like [Gigantopelta aegis]
MYKTTAYDAVWTIARAFNATIYDLKNTEHRLEDFSYSNTYIGELIKNNTSKVNFRSISNRVVFDKNGDVIRPMRILQMQDGYLVPVGWYNKIHTGEKTQWGTFKWPSKLVPKDSMQLRSTHVCVSTWLYVIMCTVASMGILMAVLFLYFNIKFHAERIIKMSSPWINNVILVGCIILYMFVYVSGLDNSKFSSVCQASVFFIVVGFSLAFGALFAKTWRVHVIYTASLKMKKRAPKDKDLFIKIGVLTAINASIMVFWTVFDPLVSTEVYLRNLKTEEPHNDRVVVPVTWHCTSRYHIYFYGVLLGIQGILLLLGVFLAFTTRKVTILELNDSKYIGMCIYNVIVLASVGLPVALILKGSVNVTYGLLSSLIIAGTTATQCLIFIPKVYGVKLVNIDVNDVRPTIGLSTNPATAGDTEETLSQYNRKACQHSSHVS